jgi:hypothetical protein
MSQHQHLRDKKGLIDQEKQQEHYETLVRYCDRHQKSRKLIKRTLEEKGDMIEWKRQKENEKR